MKWAENHTVSRGMGMMGLMLIMLLLSCARADISSGQAWLQAQQHTSGEYSRASDSAQALQSTSETVSTFSVLGLSLDAPQTKARVWLRDHAVNNSEWLSRKIISQAEVGLPIADLLTQLKTHQNADGGFGDERNTQSTVWDTAWALKALSIAQQDTSVVHSAIGWLVAHQNNQGGFINPTTATSQVETTSLASMALQSWRFSFNLTLPIEQASQFLRHHRDQGLWQSDLQTATALLALIPLATDHTIDQLAIDSLKHNQLPNGSWQNDVYLTALSLRILHFIKTTPITPPPAQSYTLQGRVLDAQTQQPIASATVLFQGLTQQTNRNGEFNISLTQMGVHSLTIQQAGFIEYNQSINTVVMQNSHVGDVLLTRQSNTAILRGIVTDAATQQPIARANIVITGSDHKTLTTDQYGEYLTDIMPGNITIAVSATDYHRVTGSAQAVAGTILQFSPALTKTAQPVPTTLSLSGRLIDAQTQLPIANALVLQNNLEQAHSDANGEFGFIDTAVGDHAYTVTVAGYQPFSFNVSLPVIGRYLLGDIQLQPIVLPQTSRLEGTITDADTNQPVVGAQLSINGYTVQSNAQGQFYFDSLSDLQFSVVIQANGYHSRTEPISLTQHGHYRMDLSLTVDPTPPPAADDITIDSFNPDQTQYLAYTEVKLVAHIQNHGADNREVWLRLRAYDAQSRFLEEMDIGLNNGLSRPDGRSILVPHLQTLQESWFTRHFSPGQYRLQLQIFDVGSNRVVAERDTHVTLLATKQIDQIRFVTAPVEVIKGSTERVKLNVVLRNRSNVPQDIAFHYQWQDLQHQTLAEDNLSINLQPQELFKTVLLDEIEQNFTTSGFYPINWTQLSGEIPKAVQLQPLYIAPGNRIDIEQTLTPDHIFPDTDRSIRNEIIIKGVEE